MGSFLNHPPNRAVPINNLGVFPNRPNKHKFIGIDRLNSFQQSAEDWIVVNEFPSIDSHILTSELLSPRGVHPAKGRTLSCPADGSGRCLQQRQPLFECFGHHFLYLTILVLSQSPGALEQAVGDDEALA